MDHCTRNVRKSALLIALLSFSVLAAQDAPLRTLAVMDFDSFGVSVSEVQALTHRLLTNFTQLDVYRIIERGLMLDIASEQNFHLIARTINERAVDIVDVLGVAKLLACSVQQFLPFMPKRIMLGNIDPIRSIRPQC